MCVIVMQPAGKILSGNKFRNCWSRNRDGGGYAFINDEGGLTVKKGFFVEKEMLEEYRVDHEAQPKSPFLLHFRISTSGLINADNCHPHWVREDLVMAHNGHITGYGSSEQSDTLEFVATILKNMPDRFEEQEVLNHLVESYISGDKMVLFRNDGEYVILNEEKGNWQDGLWFSNKSWEKKPAPKQWMGWNKGKPVTKGVTPPASQYTACGWNTWDDDDSDLWFNKSDDPVSYYEDQDCAFCDGSTNREDAEFCLELDAWYPICINCILDNEQELVHQGVIADAVEEVWDEMFPDSVVDEEEEEEKDRPATSKLLRLTSNIFGG